MKTPKVKTALVLGALGLLLGLLVASPPSWRPASPEARSPRPFVAAASAETPPRSAPAPLQSKVEQLAQAFGDEVGVAILDLQEGWIVQVRGDRPAPQQSVSKLWVAIAVLDAADRGELDLEAPVLFTDADRSVFFQPIVGELEDGLYVTTSRDLLRRAIVTSDNAANDRLIGGLGGVARAGEVIGHKRLTVRIGAEERELQAQIAGLRWRPNYGHGAALKQARAQLPLSVRRQARDAYLAAPMDGASPAAVVEALARLHRGELLSPAATQELLRWMQASTTGPRRLRAGLPPDWRIAHKTGTGQDLEGGSIGINDVGLLMAPDGRTYAVAVMIPYTRQPVRARLALMQAIAAAVVEQWRRDGETPRLVEG